VTAPAEVDLPDVDDATVGDSPWVTIVWNDPVNLMSYVTHVLMELFGYPREHAEKLMLDVHQKGRAGRQQRHPRADGARRRPPARQGPVGHPAAGLMRFSRKRSGRIEGKADAVEADVLSSLAADLLVLLGEQDEPTPTRWPRWSGCPAAR
jgi:hypothetical protein